MKTDNFCNEGILRTWLLNFRINIVILRNHKTNYLNLLNWAIKNETFWKYPLNNTNCDSRVSHWWIWNCQSGNTKLWNMLCQIATRHFIAKINLWKLYNGNGMRSKFWCKQNVCWHWGEIIKFGNQRSKELHTMKK